MTVSAELVHRMKGRARLRLRRDEADATLLSRLARGLSERNDVLAVETNPRSLSLLVTHRGELEAILEDAKCSLGLELSKPTSRESSALRGVHDAFQALDLRLKAQSPNGSGLGTYAFYGLVAASLYQLARGNFLPAGATLAHQAMGILFRTLEAERK
jgi:hypothetical protein